ncbi:hypothetical protein [Ralstonia phage p2110]|nr:hypothetical protein [Ralstonia phage p2110]
MMCYHPAYGVEAENHRLKQPARSFRRLLWAYFDPV